MTASFVPSFLQHRSPLIFTSTCNTNHGARPMAFSSNTAGGRGVLKLVITSSSGGTSTLQCNAISSTGNTEDDLWVVKRNEEHVIVVKDDDSADILVESIKHMLRSLDDREISLSPYDTAWVALVKDVEGGGGPQFPESLDWISNNQLGDGSWGDSCFLVYDRILNTLACVVALKSWNMHMHHHQINKGILFIKQNIERLENEDVDHMPSGFEVVFPSLLDMAKKLQLDIDVNSHGTSTFMKEIYAARDLKLNKIPKEVMHKVATPLLFSLEGMSDLMWDKLMKFQAGDGSFLYSPASTAYALDQTKDDKCLQYIQNCLCKFNGGVPMAYPMELYEYIWTVDRLQRLGISRYFEREIEERMEYVHRYWTNRGIGWTRNSQIPDLDDTAMGFRLLRMHGYHISPGN